MHATFADSPTGQGTSASLTNPKQFVEGIKKFIFISENPNNFASFSGYGYGLSDLGFVLLQLKESLVTIDQRSINVAPEFASKQHSGLTLLLKTVVILQGIVQNSIAQKNPSKLTQLLNRKNTTTSNVRRKSSVCEADCIECIKIILEKVPPSWRIFLDNQHNLEIILHSINSPQLDSKCYSLEIVIQLLDHEHGFDQLFKSLTIVSARIGEYERLILFTNQLKYGLHTNKLHIQILIAKFMNKLLLMAPTQHHKQLAMSEALLANYSQDYIKRLLSTTSGHLVGTEVLSEEINIWNNLSLPIDKDHSLNSKSVEDSMYDNDYSYNLAYNNSTGKSRKNVTSLAKNVERHKFRRYGEGTPPLNDHIPHNSTLVSSKNQSYDDYDQQHGKDESMNTARRGANAGLRFENIPEAGKMRRVKSESAMIIEPENRHIEDEEEDERANYNAEQQSRSYKKPKNVMSNVRQQYESPTYTAPIRTGGNKAMSKSINDLSLLTTNLRTDDHRKIAPPRLAISPNLPYHHQQPSIQIIPASQTPHAGFSYLFPNAPVVSGRLSSPTTVSPRPISSTLERDTKHHLTDMMHSRPLSLGSKSGPTSPNPQTSSNYHHHQHHQQPQHYSNLSTSNANLNNVVYIPIQRQPTLERQKAGFSPKVGDHERSNNRGILRTESSRKTPYTEDVKDALSKFDYLNDYDEASLTTGSIGNLSKGNHAVYHF
uniref:NR LBD domain-containing protein n=1 Tax=Rhabditophanes sp. KR3021 TaxID=114890 RepID=A0AC35TK62_9BILA